MVVIYAWKRGFLIQIILTQCILTLSFGLTLTLFNEIRYTCASRNSHSNWKSSPIASGFQYLYELCKNSVRCTALSKSRLLLMVLQIDLYASGCFNNFLLVSFLKNVLMIDENRYKRKQCFPKYILLKHLWLVLGSSIWKWNLQLWFLCNLEVLQ